MKLKTLCRNVLVVTLGFGAGVTPSLSLAQSKTATVCFSDAAVDPIGAGLLPILVQTDQLIAVEMLDGASAQYVYLLTRQMVLTERILRRLLGRGSDCEAIANNIATEYAMLKRGFDAFAQGDPSSGVEPVASRRSQALLTEIRSNLAQTDAAVLALVRIK